MEGNLERIQEVIKKIKKIRITTRKKVTEMLSGEYISIFKGKGIEFVEEREYEIGDDIRLIDWNTTARHNIPYVKIYAPERELNIFVCVDGSASMMFPDSTGKSKKDIALEVLGVISFLSIKNRDKVALFIFSDDIEKTVPLDNKPIQFFKILREYILYENTHKPTTFENVLNFFANTFLKKGILFFISDFLVPYNKSFEKLFSVISRKYDFIPVFVYTKELERYVVEARILMEDLETGDIEYTNLMDISLGDKKNKLILANYNSYKKLFKKIGVEWIEIDSSADVANVLEKFFMARGYRY